MKKILYGVVLLITLVFNSCNSLDVAPPNNITDEQIMEILNGNDEEKKLLILKALGSTLNTNFSLTDKAYLGYSNNNQTTQVDQEFIRNLMGNDVVNGNFSTSGDYHGGFYNLLSTHRQTENTWSMWAMPADMIIAANKVLLYITEEAAEKSTKVKEYRGSALAVHAYGYMLLMERFQKAYTNGGKDGRGMPLYTSYGINPTAEISSATDTYKLIMDELKEAESCMKSVGYTKDKYDDIDLGVVQYLLARAALWCGEWNTCITACQSILAAYPDFIAENHFGGKAINMDSYVDGSMDLKAEDNAFYELSQNPECIMGFKAGDAGNAPVAGTTGNNLFYYYANVFGSGQGGYSRMWPRIDERLYAKMDDNDFRKDNFTTVESKPYHYIFNKQGESDDRTIDAYANLKFAATMCKGVDTRDYQNTADQVTIRSSEVVLMMAEAYAQSGQDTQAKTALNKLLAARTKAGATQLTCDNYKGMQGMTALQMVQLQWRLEMWCEKGLEYYNNKRWNIPVDRTSSNTHFSNVKTLSVDDMVLEIPREETNTNPNWSK
ncbi:MAG: RagB/SusD family nutrient uptake outer membrane protein [Prevotella sp.]|nr:RagB/SusD family nutrient uptake outer membrane protein [Bacteroidales bacterium]